MERKLSIQAIAWVLDHSESSRSARHVLISIANHANKFGYGAYPSLATIASESKITRETVPSCVRELERIGEVTVRRGAGPHGCNLYSLTKMCEQKEHPELDLDLDIEVVSADYSQSYLTEGGVRFDGKRGKRPLPEPSLTVKEEPTTKAVAALPEWVPLEAWEAFGEMRRRVRKPLTAKAVELAIKRLEELKQRGYPPQSVLEASTLNCWQGLFPPRKEELKRGEALVGQGPSAGMNAKAIERYLQRGAKQ